tara:strand:+ start:175 stop:885 length:711 start_codon:yes stop_codon:yes gene_type:complete
MEVVYKRLISRFQSSIRTKLFHTRRLPNSLFTVKKILQEHNIILCNKSNDGRVNSCMDEDEIINILLKKMPNRVVKQKTRMWYDILIYDYIYGWLPVNIKTTTTLTSDNTGNLAMCVYAYTDEELDLYKKYQNGNMSTILIDKLNKKEYNYRHNKDYFFVIVNKNNKNDIIINSVKGLTTLTPNINNLPFQVCWCKNRTFKHKPITESIKMFLDAIQKPKPSWKETFLSDIRNTTL